MSERRAAPGGVLGIVGAGQLGRMIALAAARLGLRCHVFAPESGPAFDVCAGRTIGSYDDEGALARFAAACDVVTYEFENVPAASVAALSSAAPVRPGARALSTTQDRLTEKRFLRKLGLATAPFEQIDDAAGLAAAADRLGRPSILKTRRFGYDGKGQALVREGDDPRSLLRILGDQPAILEGFVPFAREASVVAARGLDGEFAAFDVCENRHENHILALTLAPAALQPRSCARAVEMARAIAEALDYVGVLAVELFVVEAADGREDLIVNEIAPRVHNSGHWTIDAAATSQFEQHVRAVCGWPLGATDRLGRVEMRNLIGAEAASWRSILAEAGARLHLYGKNEARPGRKMGHVTRILR